MLHNSVNLPASKLRWVHHQNRDRDSSRPYFLVVIPAEAGIWILSRAEDDEKVTTSSEIFLRYLPSPFRRGLG